MTQSPTRAAWSKMQRTGHRTTPAFADYDRFAQEMGESPGESATVELVDARRPYGVTNAR